MISGQGNRLRTLKDKKLLHLSNNSLPQLRRTVELLRSSNNSADILPHLHYSLDLLLERNKNSYLDREARLLLLQSNNYRLCIMCARCPADTALMMLSAPCAPVAPAKMMLTSDICQIRKRLPWLSQGFPSILRRIVISYRHIPAAKHAPVGTHFAFCRGLFVFSSRTSWNFTR